MMDQITISHSQSVEGNHGDLGISSDRWQSRQCSGAGGGNSVHVYGVTFGDTAS